MDYLVFVLLTPLALFVIFLPVRAVWSYRAKPITLALLLYLFATAGFFLGNTLEILAPTAFGTLFWVAVNHMLFLVIASTWVLFALGYVGFEHLILSRKRYFLAIMPAVTLSIILSNAHHGLFWVDFNFFQVGRFLTARGSYGPWFWINGVYVYVLLVSGVAIIATGLGVSKPIYSRQSGVVMLGSILPIVLNLSYVFQLFPSLNKDFTAVGFTMSGLAFYIGVHRYGLIRVTPISQRLVLEDIHSGVLVMEPGGHLTECNGAAETIVGQPHTELIGRHWSSVAEIDALLRGVNLGEKTSFETSRGEGLGTAFFEVWISPIRQRTGRFAGTVVTIHDVTERTRLIENRKIALVELEERTQRMNQLQLTLLHQEKLAAVGQLSAGVAHDLNNPLTFMRSGFSTLEREFRRLLPQVPSDRISPEERSELEKELDAVASDFDNGFQRIRELLHSLMRLTHPDDVNEFENAAVNEILESTLDLVAPALKGKAQVRRNLDPDLPEICCLRGPLSSVFLNLVLNGLHSIETEYERGSPYPGEIVVSTERTDFGVRCSIQDSGPGVAPNMQEKIFEPFVTTKASGKGTGLGLSISRDIIVNRHAGRLYVDSGAPNTFVIELPLRPKLHLSSLQTPALPQQFQKDPSMGRT